MPKKAKKDGSYTPNVKIKRYRTHEQLIKKIIHQRGLSRTYVEKALRYNILTIGQLSKITGMSSNAIHLRLLGHKRNGRQHYSLNSCDPFDETYHKFIYRNPKCQLLIEKYAGYKLDLGQYVDAEHEVYEQEDVSKK